MNKRSGQESNKSHRGTKGRAVKTHPSYDAREKKVVLRAQDNRLFSLAAARRVPQAARAAYALHLSGEPGSWGLIKYWPAPAAAQPSRKEHGNLIYTAGTLVWVSRRFAGVHAFSPPARDRVRFWYVQQITGWLPIERSSALVRALEIFPTIGVLFTLGDCGWCTRLDLALSSDFYWVTDLLICIKGCRWSREPADSSAFYIKEMEQLQSMQANSGPAMITLNVKGKFSYCTCYEKT